MSKTFGELLGAEIRERRESAGMTQRELAEESFPHLDATDTIERRIRELESDTPPANPRAKTYQPICDTLNITRDMIRAMKASAANAKEQAKAEREELREDIGPLPDALADPSGLSRNHLIALAELFGHDRPEDQPDTALRDFLTKKAEEYRAYRETIDALDDRVAAIANLKGAAQGAAERFDFDEVEALLSRVDEVETEIAAETKVARARNALLRGDVDHAFHILSAAADSFASIDPLEPARRRLDAMALLYEHGLRYAGVGLSKAAEMTRAAICLCPRDSNEELWGALQNNLGATLSDLGERRGDPDTLLEAVTAYRAVLEVYSREAMPVDWAMTQNNLGDALRELGARSGDTGTLQEAVTAFRAALEVRTLEAMPFQFALTMENLAIVLCSLAGLSGRADPAADLTAALEAVDAALSVYTPEHTPFYFEKATRLRDAIRAAQEDLG